MKSALCDDSDSDWNTVVKLKDLLVRVKRARKTEIRHDPLRQLNPASNNNNFFKNNNYADLFDDNSTIMTPNSGSILSMSSISSIMSIHSV